jgi:hypothetical protein
MSLGWQSRVWALGAELGVIGGFGDLRLDGRIFHELPIVIVDDVDTALVLIIICCAVMGNLLLEPVHVVATLEELRDQVLVDDVPLELHRTHSLTVTELEMLNEKRGAMEFVVATGADQLLVDLV